MFKKISLIFVLALLLSSFFVKPVEAKAIPVRVPADVEWVDTGIDVDDGETLNLKAKGMAITGPLNIYPDAISGPGGQVTICPDVENPTNLVCAMEGKPFGALIGKIGEDGSSFYIGDALSIEAGESGRLYLAVNDYYDTYDDNQAGFTVIFK
jgi:hypothetical protein